jgi:predicted type IV restriction endonuclease
MALPSEVARLVEMFERNREDYLHGRYSETQLRREYLDPFFKALGWDVDNTQGYAEAYKDVIHEDAIRIGSATKAPDYCFRIGGTRKFFVEAKAPTVNLKDNAEPAYQVRRYAWSAKLLLSILTDFEEFAVYDCRDRPNPSDKASKGRVKYYRYTDYAEHWDEIASVFSREAVLKGSFDKYAVSERRKKGTAEVDAAFLAEIEEWRDKLAHNIALRNTELSNRQLNYAVQITIDRIIFLRICEDRGIERYGELMALLNGTDLYPRLMSLFRKADDRYNSGLFHFQREKGRHEGPDELTPELVIDDKPLKEIIRSLYYPDSPYEFSVLPAEILGQVYEQFLGKVIVLTAGHHAKVEDKPEVKKAGGVFYTPSYIVEYIVKQTVGKLLEGASITLYKSKPPKLDRPLRVLDPACGSGSFLLGAYQLLLDWYLDYYQKNDPKAWAATKEAPICQSGGQGWKLTTQERKRILLEHIYGVDIDTQAVEVTKLSLLLRVLEGEKNLVLFHNERALPDLSNNIKCGNSLIGPDFYKNQQLDMFDTEERYRVNAFDWQTEFPEAFKEHGFDAVIGNPPYIRSQLLAETDRRYFSLAYEAATHTYDIYVVFLEQGLRLLNSKGKLGFILPNKFFTTDYGEGIRRLIAKRQLLRALVDFQDGQVFSRAGTYTTLIFLSSAAQTQPQYVALGDEFRKGGERAVSDLLSNDVVTLSQMSIPEDGSRWTLGAGVHRDLLSRLHAKYPMFSTLNPHIFQGLKTSADKVYLLHVQTTRGGLLIARNALGEAVEIEKACVKPIVKGEHVQRYSIDTSSHMYIIYPYELSDSGQVELMPEHTIKRVFPKTWEYLLKNRSLLGARDKGKWAKRVDWYAYARSQNIGTFPGEKLLLPYMTTRLRASIDRRGDLFFVNISTGGYGLRADLQGHSILYLLGILNSRLMDYAIAQMTNRFRGGYFAVNKQGIERLPFRRIDFTSDAERQYHDGMVTLVESMLQLYEVLSVAKTPAERTSLERQIAATDAEIDRLVYELYGLTEEEIRIVEGATQ